MHDEMIAVIEAHKEGKPIQFRGIKPPNICGWETLTTEPSFDFWTYEYRVVPEPRKPREWWIYLCETDSIIEYSPMTRAQQELSKCGKCKEIIRVREVLEDDSVVKP